MPKKTLIIATRTSALALWQANHIRTRLIERYPDLNVELNGIKTLGDKRMDVSLQKIGGKGVFVKELEEALLNKEADLAVHSLKDMPAILPAGLGIVSICERENPYDAWVCPKNYQLKDIPTNSRVGTSSLRRMLQLKHKRPDLIYEPLRGNVDTRLSKCQSGEWDAIVLAVAGLTRLNKQDHITHTFSKTEMLPAVSQGALGIECRLEDKETIELISFLDNKNTRACIEAERAMNAALGGNCQVPVAGFAQLHNGEVHLQGRVLSPFSNVILHAEARMPAQDAVLLGKHVAELLRQQGACEIIEEILNGQ